MGLIEPGDSDPRDCEHSLPGEGEERPRVDVEDPHASRLPNQVVMSHMIDPLMHGIKKNFFISLNLLIADVYEQILIPTQREIFDAR